LNFFLNFNTKCPSPQAIKRRKNIAGKLNPLSKVHQRYRRQTDNRRICDDDSR